MPRCYECRKMFPRHIKLLSDLRLEGKYCFRCFEDVIRKRTFVCVKCNCIFFDDRDFIHMGKSRCPLCRVEDIARERITIANNLRRARKVDAPAILTLSDWQETLRDFNGMCAYCQLRSYRVMEHFMPVEIEGTTKNNCVPACNKCNSLKKSFLPNDIKTISREAIERVKTYLDNR